MSENMTKVKAFQLIWLAPVGIKEKTILLWFAQRSNEKDFRCHTTLVEISKACGCTRQTVYRLIQILEKSKFIIKEKKYIFYRGKKPISYLINFSSIIEKIRSLEIT